MVRIRSLPWHLPTALLACSLALPALAADLDIEVRGLRSDQGKLFVAVHHAQEGVKFPDAAGMVAGLWRQATKGTLRFSLPDLPPGRYAVNAFHDENGNEKLDANLLGVPTEGYGFGNDAAGSFGPPAFDDAAVTVGGDAGSARTVLTLAY